MSLEDWQRLAEWDSQRYVRAGDIAVLLTVVFTVLLLLALLLLYLAK